MNKCIYLFIIFLFAISFSSAYAQKITTIAGNGISGYSGNGGNATSAKLHWPKGVTLDRSGRVYIADADNNVIRRISNTGIITTIAGNALNAGSGFGGYNGDGGPATAAEFFGPSGVAIDTAGNIFIADQFNNVIRKVDTGGIVTTVVGTGVAGFAGDGGLATAAKLNQPSKIALDTFGNMYIADVQNHRIRKVDTAHKISTIAGTGLPNYSGDGAAATAATLNYPVDVVVDTFRNIYIADQLNNCIRRIDASGNISTIIGTGIPAFSGDGGPATAARLFDPGGIALDTAGNIYVADYGNAVVRKVDKSGMISTYAGTADSPMYSGDGGLATAARLWFPMGLAVNRKGSLYIADQGNNRIRFIGSAIESVNPLNTSITGVNMYPNPSRGTFMLHVSAAYNEQARVVISNITGEKVVETTARTNVPGEIQFDGPAGVYILTVVTTQGTWSGRLVTW